MAVFTFVPVAPAGNGTNTNNIYNATLGAGANSANLTPGVDAIVRIACSAAIAIRFGQSAALTNAVATDMYFPAGVYIYDMGHLNDALNIYAFGAGTIITLSYVPRN
jgi:hypothetical protein